MDAERTQPAHRHPLQVEDTSELEQLDIFDEAGRPRRSSGSGDANLLERMKNNPRLFQGKWMPAFWTVTGVFSLLVNAVLIAVLLGLGRELFALREVLSVQLLGGLQQNFAGMDAAVISTTVEVNQTIVVDDVIQVNDSIPVVFDLEVSEKTNVRLAQETEIENAIVSLQTPSLAIFNAPTDILLPKDTILPARINMTVPVSQTVPISINVPVHLEVPVSLTVPVSIPMADTELHEPFVGLQEVVSPYQALLQAAPASLEEAACEAGPILCWWFGR